MRRLSAVAAALLLAGTLGACGDDSDDTATTGAEGGAELAASIDLTAGEYSYKTETTKAKAGVVEVNLKNDGKEMHEAFVMQIPAGKQVGDIVKALEPIVTSEGSVPIPAEIMPGGGVMEIKPGESGTSRVQLAAGEYAFFCAVDQGDTGEDNGEGPPEGEAEGAGEGPPEGEAEGEGEAEDQAKPHFTLGMVLPFTVEAGEGEAETLEGDAIVATEYTFATPELKAGKQTLTFRNDGKEIHHGVLMRFKGDVNPDEVPKIAAELFAAEESGKQPSVPFPDEVGGSSVHGPGAASTFEVDLTAGTYALLCFISDRAGGPPHAAKGMVKGFKVT